MFNFISKIAILFLSIIMVFSGFAPVSGYELNGGDDLVMSFAALSDTHIQSGDSTQTRRLMRGLEDMEDASKQPDALIIAGDLTVDGRGIEYFFLHSALTSSFDISNIILAAGDQDLNIKDNDYTKASERFTTYFNRLTGRDVSETHYSTMVNGCYFIVLGSDSIDGTRQTFGQDQLEWLVYTLNQAALNTPGRPIFIINHNPLSGTNKAEEFWANGGASGEQSGEIMEIIQQYENVFFLSGHLCAPYDNSGITTVGNVTFVDLPAYDYGGGDSGMGYIVEVYNDKVEFRIRNFLRSQWVDYSQTIELSNK